MWEILYAAGGWPILFTITTIFGGGQITCGSHMSHCKYIVEHNISRRKSWKTSVRQIVSFQEGITKLLDFLLFNVFLLLLFTRSIEAKVSLSNHFSGFLSLIERFSCSFSNLQTSLSLLELRGVSLLASVFTLKIIFQHVKVIKNNENKLYWVTITPGW